MPHYPVTPVDGEKVGANLVTRPAFPDLTKGPWSTGTVAAIDIGGGVIKNGLGSFTETQIPLGIPIQAATFRVRALVIATVSTCYIGVRPIGSLVNAAGDNIPASTPAYAWRTTTQTFTGAEAGTGFECYMRAATSGQMRMIFVRVDWSDSAVATGAGAAGYIDGDTPDDDHHNVGWDGAAFASKTSVYAIVADLSEDPEAGGGTGVGGSLAAKKVAAFLGQPSDPAVIAVADQVVPVITAMVKAYTRDQGFTVPGVGTELLPNAELSAVITSASARLVANPEQLPYDSGSVALRGAFQGWTLAEQYVLNRYRKRAA